MGNKIVERKSEWPHPTSLGYKRDEKENAIRFSRYCYIVYIRGPQTLGCGPLLGHELFRTGLPEVAGE